MTGDGVYTLYPAFQQMVKDIDPGRPDADDPVFGKGVCDQSAGRVHRRLMIPPMGWDQTPGVIRRPATS